MKFPPPVVERLIASGDVPLLLRSSLLTQIIGAVVASRIGVGPGPGPPVQVVVCAETGVGANRAAMTSVEASAVLTRSEKRSACFSRIKRVGDSVWWRRDTTFRPV